MLDETKLKNIDKLSVDECLKIMHACANRVGLAEVEECKFAHGISKREVYYKIKSGKIKHFPIGKRKFPCINS